MALNRVGGDIWMEELSQKNRNVLRPVVWQADVGKRCQASEWYQVDFYTARAITLLHS